VDHRLSGKETAPGYVMAKLIIRLIDSVAEFVNCNPDIYTLFDRKR
jgi:glucan phosphorylase